MRTPKLFLGLIAGALLVVGGAMSVSANKTVDDATSTFTKSNFDYIITSPSNAQLEQFAANKEAVEFIFPTYNFEVTLKGAGTSVKTKLLASDKMENYDISFFNPRRVVAGAYDASGIMIDEDVAIKLGATVGSEISFGLGGGNWKLPVKVIYGKVDYQTFPTGVAMISFTDEIKNGFSSSVKFNNYELAFIAAKNKSECAAMLKDYKPYGEVMTYEDYKEMQQKIREPGLSDEDFEAACQNGYEGYVRDWEAAPHINCVQDKERYMAGAEDVVATTKENSFRLSIIFAILTPLLLAGGLIAFDFIGRKTDEEEKSAGATKAELRKGIYIFDGISVGIAAVIGFIGTMIASFIIGGFDISSCLIYSLPALATLLISIPVGIVYSNMVYGKDNTQAEEAAEMPEAK